MTRYWVGLDWVRYICPVLSWISAGNAKLAIVRFCTNAGDRYLSYLTAWCKCCA